MGNSSYQVCCQICLLSAAPVVQTKARNWLFPSNPRLLCFFLFWYEKMLHFSQSSQSKLMSLLRYTPRQLQRGQKQLHMDDSKNIPTDPWNIPQIPIFRISYTGGCGSGVCWNFLRMMSQCPSPKGKLLFEPIDFNNPVVTCIPRRRWTNILLKRVHFNRTVVFQPLLFGGHVVFFWSIYFGCVFMFYV